MGLLYNLQKHVFGFIGDIKWSGLMHPFWFTDGTPKLHSTRKGLPKMPPKKMSLLYRFERKLFTFLGDIKVFGWTHPMWFEINAHGYRLKGAVYRKIRNLIKPGDIILRRYEGYLSSYMIPGFWNHAGLYIGDDGEKIEQVIHAVSEGVIQEDILNFMRTDHMIVLRLAPQEGNETAASEAVNKAKSIVGKPYDFGFDFKDTNRFSCTELVTHCYPGTVQGKKRLGKETFIADDFYNSDALTTIWDTRYEDVQQMSVVKSFLAGRCP